MQLLASATSPFARKLRIVAHELGLAYDWVETAPMEDPPELKAANPLVKVPALILDDGTPLIDSPVIAAYLLSLAPAQTLLPAGGIAHWRGRAIEAIADGILDAAIGLRLEAAMGGEKRSPIWADRMRRAIDGGIAALPSRLADYAAVAGEGLSYPQICAVVAAEYLDFRFPQIDWRAAAPELASLQAALTDRPSFKDTRPPA
jgi:glutathione S-transferase